MYKITIIPNTIENCPIAQYCVKASSFNAALAIAFELSGKDHSIKIIDL